MAEKKKKHAGGRPTKYDPAYCEKVTQFAMLGLTQQQMAAVFGVNVDTLKEWLKVHPEFSDALKAGGVDADGKVIKSLHTKATEGDTTAMIFWLKNRQRATWRDRHDVESKVEANVQVGGEVDLNLLPDSELVQLKNILQKAVKPKPAEQDKK